MAWAPTIQAGPPKLNADLETSQLLVTTMPDGHTKMLYSGVSECLK